MPWRVPVSIQPDHPSPYSLVRPVLAVRHCWNKNDSVDSVNVVVVVVVVVVSDVVVVAVTVDVVNFVAVLDDDDDDDANATARLPTASTWPATNSRLGP
jgi:hypothetical protein